MTPEAGYLEAIRPNVLALPVLGGGEVPGLITSPDYTPTYLALDFPGPFVTV
jgi:hypothetical protein